MQQISDFNFWIGSNIQMNFIGCDFWYAWSILYDGHVICLILHAHFLFYCGLVVRALASGYAGHGVDTCYGQFWARQAWDC